MSMNFFRMLENQQASYLSQHPSVVDMTISKSASGYTNHYLPRTSEIPKSLESTTPKTPTHEPSYPRLAESSRLDPRSESRLDEKAMAENRNLDNIIPPRSSDRDLDRTLERGGLDSPSLQWARNMLQAHQQLSDIKSSANHVAHGHNMTTPHLQNGTNSNGPPTMVPTNRLQVDLSCTPNINSFSPPTSLSNNGQLVVPHPLKPVKTRKSYQCKMCDQMFENKSELMLHTQQIHKQDPKPYKCPTCNKSFANSSYLSQHNRIHAGIKPYQCNFCSRKFTQLSHLQQHRRTHTGEKPYKCQHPGCGKAFTQLSNLQTHSRSHMTDKPFRCNSCYKCYADEISLREHIPKHSDTKHLKTHICRLCGKSYTQETYLARHMAKHSLDGGNSRLRLPKDSMMNFQMNRPMKPEPGIGIENCCSPRSPTGMNGQKSAFIPMTPYGAQQRPQPTQFPFPPQLQNSPLSQSLSQSLSSSLPHISCVTSPGYFPPYDPMSGHRNDSLDRELQSRDNSSMIARSLLSLQHIKSFSTTFAQSNNHGHI